MTNRASSYKEELVRVLYDGWPLIYEPGGPAGMHLQALLANLPAGVEAVVALPGPAPAWLQHERLHIHQTLESDFGRLVWEQRSLVQIARQLDAPILHTTSPGAPLFGKPIRVVSPTAIDERGFLSGHQSSQERQLPQEKRSFTARMRISLGKGGLARARAILWPADVPAPELPIPVVKLPPVAHPYFSDQPEGSALMESTRSGTNGRSRVEQGTKIRTEPDRPPGFPPEFDLPETYILYHGPSAPSHLMRLLESWQWASGPVGSDFPLVIAGIPAAGQSALSEMLNQSSLKETVKVLPAATPEELSVLYHGCSVFFYPAPLSPWGSPVRNALACGKPVVAAESSLADAIVGPAAYLAPAGDPRALGAALLTVIVEEEVAQKLGQSARERSIAWQGPAFGLQLLEAYRRLVE